MAEKENKQTPAETAEQKQDPTPAPQGVSREEAQAMAAEAAKKVVEEAQAAKAPEAPPEEPPAPAGPSPEVEKLQADLAQKTEQLGQLQAVVEARLQSDMEGLDEQEQSLVKELGGEDPVQQLKAFATLRKAGKIGHAGTAGPGKPAESGGKKRIDLSGDEEGKPSTFEEAEAEFRRRAKGMV